MYVPDGILCSQSHQWVLKEGNIVSIGLTDYIIEQLGDIVSIDLPEIGVEFLKDEVFATIESIEKSDEIYMPLSGKIVEINEKLINSPELINDDSFLNWLIKIEPKNYAQESQILLDYDDYKDELQ